MSFLHQVIVQLSNNGAHIDYGALDMPGRTPKALKHQLDKVRAAGAAHQKESGQAPAEVSRSRARGPANKAAGSKSIPIFVYFSLPVHPIANLLCVCSPDQGRCQRQARQAS